MRKITILLTVIVLGISSLFAQTTLEVGEGKTFTTIKAAWDAAKTDPATEITINIAEGTYLIEGGGTNSLGPIANKKITLVGAGADKTFVKRFADGFTLPGTGGHVDQNPNRLFQFNTAESNLDLILEKMSFQNMGFNNSNGGGFVNVTSGGGTNLKFTFRNCNFNNIMARAGGIIQTQVADAALSILFENCFIENCGAFDNNGMNGLIAYQSGSCTIKNTTFMNNIFNAINIGNKSPGTDRNLQSGALVNGNNTASTLNVENCYVVNNKFLFGDTDKTHPMFAMKSNIGADSVFITIKNLISVGNKRASSYDCDLYYQNIFNPVMENVILNAVRNFDRVPLTETTDTLYDADVPSIAGTVIIDQTKTYNSPEVNFEMDATTNLPKIFVNATTGVKYLNRLPTGLADNRANDLKIKTDKGLLNISSDKVENITIYNVLGAKLAHFNQVNYAEIALTSGAYIIKTATSSVKVLLK